MKAVFSCLLLFLAAVAQALSATGDRLLTVWEDVEDKKLYSKYLEDLEGMFFLFATPNRLQLLTGHFSVGRGFKITHATPKQDDLKLQHLGERVYDQVMFFPIKAKGMI